MEILDSKDLIKQAYSTEREGELEAIKELAREEFKTLSAKHPDRKIFVQIKVNNKVEFEYKNWNG